MGAWAIGFKYEGHWALGFKYKDKASCAPRLGGPFYRYPLGLLYGGAVAVRGMHSSFLRIVVMKY